MITIFYIFLFWFLPFILYLCYPIVFIYWTHKLLKTDNEHFTIGDLFKEANKEFYNDELYNDGIAATLIPVFNWIMLFFIMKLELECSYHIHDKYLKYIKNPIYKFLKYIYKVIRFILYPIIYTCKVISIGISEVKKYVLNIRII